MIVTMTYLPTTISMRGASLLCVACNRYVAALHSTDQDPRMLCNACARERSLT